jgi:tetratricopeptide (TPR) repeat protein
MKNPQTMRIRAFCLTGLCGLLAIVGCRSKPGADQKKKSTQESAPHSTDDAKPSMEKALLYYIEGYNTLIAALQHPLDDYLKNIKDAEGSFKEKPKLSPFTADDEQNIEKAASYFAKGKAVTPLGREELSGPSEKAMARARAVIEDYNDAVRYFSAEKLKDDQGKAKRDIHERMKGGIQSYIAAISEMDKALAVIEKKKADDDLKRHLDTSTYGHQFRAFTVAAMAFVNANTKEDPVNTEEAYADLDKAYKKLKSFADQKGGRGNPAFVAYMRQARDIHEHAAVMRQDLKDHSAEDRMTRNFDLMVVLFNNLLGFTNALYEQESSGALQ